MINAYPITMLNSYQTTKDYYKVSAVRSVSGSGAYTSRQFLNLPYEQLPYKQLARSAAQSLSGLVQSAQNAKQSAQAWLSKSARLDLRSEADSEKAIAPLEKFVASYNEFQKSLSESQGQLNQTLALGMEQAAKSYKLESLGITPQEDGSLLLQVDEFKKQASGRFADVSKKLKSLSGFASLLSSTADKLGQLPTDAFFQMQRSSLQPYGQYRPQLQTYLPVPMTGLLLDERM